MKVAAIQDRTTQSGMQLFKDEPVDFDTIKPESPVEGSPITLYNVDTRIAATADYYQTLGELEKQLSVSLTNRGL